MNYNETIVRSVFFVGGFLLFGLLQFVIPSRTFEKERWQYMASNIVLVLCNNIMLILLPLIPYQTAIIAQEKGIGIFHWMETFAWGYQLEKTGIAISILVIQILILDLVIYFQHRLFHHVPFLWRFHAMHHIDPMLDTTSGLRFHPIEIIISNFIKVAVILMVGINPLSVLIFEVALNFLAMFNHSNLSIPEKLEQKISKIVITPALHTIHHAKNWEMTNSNFGFSVPWWDKFFGTFLSNGIEPQENIEIGIVPMPKKKWIVFPGMLLYPFKK